MSELGTWHSSLFRNDAEHPFCLRLDHTPFEKHRMMLNLEPGFDEIVIMLARWMARLAGRVTGKRGFQISQVHNLPERRYGSHNLRIIWHRRSHIHSVYVTAHGEW